MRDRIASTLLPVLLLLPMCGACQARTNAVDGSSSIETVAVQPSAIPTNRPAAWAQPLTVEGVPNLHKIAGGLYRSAQPTAQGMQNLRAIGVKTIVNLRTFHSDNNEIGTNGLQQELIPMMAWDPEPGDAVRFLKIVTHPERAPVLFHCRHGADRTGIMCAIYRIAIQGWRRQDAIDEMTKGGYGFHEVWVNLPKWIAALDIEKIKQEAGIKPRVNPPASGPSASTGQPDSIPPSKE